MADQRIREGLSAANMKAFFRQWLACLPYPSGAKDRQAGYRYQ